MTAFNGSTSSGNNVYHMYKNKELNETEWKYFMVKSYKSSNKLKCIGDCSKISNCRLISFNKMDNSCKYYRKYLFEPSTLIDNPSGKYFIYHIDLNSFRPSTGLTNYWIFNGDVNDAIGDAHLYDGLSASLTFDRFGRENSALSLINGYYRVPPGVYFSGTRISFMAWVKVRNYGSYSKLIDFGNGQTENIQLSLSNSDTGKPYSYFSSGSLSIWGDSNSRLILNKWQHLAYVFSFPNYFIYIDGIEVTTPGSKTSYASFSFANVIRSSNFIGRSNWAGNSNADADFDDLKIFNRALTAQEIQFEMNNNL